MHLHRVPVLFLILSLGLPPALTAAPAPAVVPPPGRFDPAAIDAWLNAQVHQASRVGLSVAILRDGHLVMAKGYGLRSVEAQRPVETNTLFAIGSVSKQFTCACILLLAEDGKLSVHDPVAKWYPGLSRAKDITLLDLMNHVSGYPDYYPLDFVDRRMQQKIDPDELLRQYAGGVLDFAPGTRWSYSNTGYILLGRVVENVSGQPLGTFLSSRIFQPLGMDHTAYEPPASDSRLAQGYTTFALSGAEPIALEGSGWLGGAGGIFSTSADLARWDLALMEGRVLKADSFKLMATARVLDGGQSSDYGCGLSIRMQGGRQVLSHNGAVSGFNTWNAMIPSTRSAVIMTCNLDGGLGTLPNRIFALLLNEASPIPVVHGPPAVEQVKALFGQLRNGKVDRSLLGEEFNHFLTDQRIAGAIARLKPYRSLRSAELTNRHERGGMEVTTTRLTFKNGALRALMYRMPNGSVEQFFVDHE